MKRLCLLAISLAFVSCGSSSPASPSPSTPPPPAIQACQSNHTAQVALKNASPNNFVFDVIIDGINRGTIRPEESTAMVTVTADMAHRIVSRVTNTFVVACDASPSFVQCSTQTLTCRY